MKSLFIAAGLALLCGSATAAGTADVGKGKAAVCMSCHGANGVGIAPVYPNLAGQKADYMVLQLKAFKEGTRKGANAAQMYGMVAGLSDQDMEDIAAFFSSLTAAK